MPSAIEHIDDRIGVLNRQIAACMEEIRSRQSYVSDLRTRLEELTLLRSNIQADGTENDDEDTNASDEESSQVATGDDESGPGEPRVISPAINGQKLLGPTEAVLEYLEDKTSPVRPVRVVNAVEKRVSTQAADPRRSLFNTINNLIHSKKIVRTQGGKIVLRKHYAQQKSHDA